MSHGIIVKNNSGGVLIDDQYANFTYKEKSSQSISSGWNTISFSSSTSNNVLYGARPTTSGYLYYGGLVKSGSNYTGFRIHSTASMTLAWIVYEDTVQNTIPDYGLVVYDSSANVTFSSEEKYMKLLSINTGSGSSGTPPGTGASVTVNDVDNNYFYAQTTNYYKGDWNYTGTGCSGSLPGKGYKFWGTGWKKVSSTSINQYTNNEIFSGTTSIPDSEYVCSGSFTAAGTSKYTLLEIEDTS